MTHILIVFEEGEPCNIETRRVFKLLEDKGLLESRGLAAVSIKIKDLIWSDVVLFVRSTSSIEKDLVKLAKRMGKFVILSIDDDFLSLGDSYGADGSGYRKIRHRCLRGVLADIDCLITVNELLSLKYTKYCNTSRFVITNTVVDKTEFYETKQNGTPKDEVKVAIYVNDGTQGYFNSILRPALRLLKERNGKRIALYLMALHPDMSEFESVFDVHYVPHMPYYDFKKYLGTEGFDIGLAPLTDDEFSKYKYFNKYIEYTLAGIPAIYTDCPLYRLVIKDGYNGVLTNNSSESWCDAITQMIEDAGLRKSIIESAQKHLFDNFESEKVLNKLIEDLSELTQYKSADSLLRFLSMRLFLIKLNYSIFKIKIWLGTAYTMLRKGNIKEFFKRFKTRILKL